jgi:hypothetical protein
MTDDDDLPPAPMLGNLVSRYNEYKPLDGYLRSFASVDAYFQTQHTDDRIGVEYKPRFGELYNKFNQKYQEYTTITNQILVLNKKRRLAELEREMTKISRYMENLITEFNVMRLLYKHFKQISKENPYLIQSDGLTEYYFYDDKTHSIKQLYKLVNKPTSGTNEPYTFLDNKGIKHIITVDTQGDITPKLYKLANRNFSSLEKKIIDGTFNNSYLSRYILYELGKKAEEEELLHKKGGKRKRRTLNKHKKRVSLRTRNRRAGSRRK